MHDHAGVQLKEASFSSPVTVIGFDTIPKVGAPFRVYAKKKEAEMSRLGGKNDEKFKGVSNEAGTLAFNVVVKADAAGSLEAILSELSKLSDDSLSVQVVQDGIGTVTEADVKSALSSEGTMIIGFNVGVDASATEMARQNSVNIETFTIIYELSDRVGKLMDEARPKKRSEEIFGKARVLKLFSRQKDTHYRGTN